MKKKSRILINIGLIIAFIGVYIFNPTNLNPLYPDGAFTWLVVFSILIAVNFVSFSVDEIAKSFQHKSPSPFVIEKNNKKTQAELAKGTKIALGIVIPFWIVFIGVYFISMPLFNSNVYRDQLGDAQITEFSDDIQLMDLNQIPIVDKDLAKTLADKKLGENPGMGSQVFVGEPVIQQVNGELVWVVPLHHSGFFKWISNTDGTPGYIVVSATNLQDIEFVEAPIKYQPNSYFFDDITRYLRVSKGYMFDGITDYSFELDDNGVPHWIITTYSNEWLFDLPEATGVIVLNATTGETDKYTVDNTPEWVDRVQPESFIINQIDNQGQYVHGVFNFSNKDKFMSSGDSAIIYNEGNCYLFTGLTSVGADESAIAFMMVDMVTKQPKLYQISGATEYAAMMSAMGSVQQYGYIPTSPIIINHNGIPTYFITLKDNSGLIKQYSFVSVSDVTSVGVGDTIATALRDYDNVISSSTSFEFEEGELTTTTGKLIRIAAENTDNGVNYKFIVEGLEDKLFTINSEESAELAISIVGDEVEVEYYDSSVGVITATRFDNLEFNQDTE